MTDKDLIKDMIGVTVYIAGWLLAAVSVAVVLGLFFGIVTKVARAVAG